MIRSNPRGEHPEIDKSAYVDPSAVIIGKVKIGKNVFIAPGAIIRADEKGSSIVIKDNCNIQDRVIVHSLGNSKVTVGENTSLSHGCIVHGPCEIGKYCFIGFGSVIFRAELKGGVFVECLAGVLSVDVPTGRMIGSGKMVDTERKAKRLKTVSKKFREFSRTVLKANLDLLEGYKKGKE